MIKKGIDFFQ